MVCICGGKKIYYRRPYEGQELCKKCFVQSIEKKVKRTVRQNKLLESGDKIGVALSGGKDSSAALYIMAQIVKKRKDMAIFAISIDEGLGPYRTKTIKKSVELCEMLGVPHHII
ncbi:MAG: asparagine synthase-related protein, partial [Candidatus Aenigmatarchaeota archaeon]